MFTANAENFLWNFLQGYALGVRALTGVGWASGLKFRGISGQPVPQVLSYQGMTLHRTNAVEW
jgi:hypothetical protein